MRSGPSGIGVRRRTAREESSEVYDERREQLLRAAAKVFRAKGFHATSVSEIAAEFGSDRASLYYYVGSKEELFEMVVEQAVLENVQMAEQIRDGAEEPGAKLREILIALMRSYDVNFPQLFVFLQEDTGRLTGKDEAWSNRMQEWSRRYFQAVRDVIQTGIDSGVFASVLPVAVIAQGVVGMVSWSHRWYQPGSGVPAEEIGARFADTLLGGLERSA
ncbi:TetR/AcrR family transcriptional regulator [Rhodococcus sp. USK10]|uniref:TetR/AcrR family transcriptional regulator n=1 Tax=Rhodococcus TaxID=1827 RepID=UPI000F55F486|nr:MULTISPECIES: TetR/AcrR family transcriptional regulator [Rhodococcus]QYB07069.1 TetR/AcrR family transcriptional regulator [Rhodococcus sp. USK10]